VRRAFMLVELMMAVVLAALVIALAWQLYLGERTRFEADQDRLAGLQGALLLDEYLAWDLERIAVNLADGAGFTYTAPVQIVDGRELRLAVVEADDPNLQGVKPVLVNYRFDPATGRVSRVAGDKERTFAGLLAEDIQFQLVPATVIWPPGSGPLTGADKELMYVKYVLTALSESQKKFEPDQRSAVGRITLVGAAALRPRGDHVYHAYWRPLRSELIEAP
jgi:type II secretory pathway pseudopilin PulG